MNPISKMFGMYIGIYNRNKKMWALEKWNSYDTRESLEFICLVATI